MKYKFISYNRTLGERLSIWWEAVRWSTREYISEVFSFPPRQGRKMTESEEGDYEFTFVVDPHPLRVELDEVCSSHEQD